MDMFDGESHDHGIFLPMHHLWKERRLMTNVRFFWFLPLFLASLLVGCTSGGQKTESVKNPAAGERPDLYFEISALGSASYFYDHREGLKLAGEQLGVETQYKGPADLNIQAMVQAIELAVSRKPGGIMVVGFEESLNDAVNKAVEAGIPVVTLDSDLPNSKRIAFVGTGNYDA
jgi:ribose transport system substrate-binding protein